MPEIVEHADGVYLGLPEEAYHADWAIGSSALHTLYSSPPDWWWESPFNQLAVEKTPKDTEALRFGSALHVALLEGMDVFTMVYGVEPSKFDHPSALDTMDQMKDWLVNKGQPKSGSKGDLIKRILAIDPKVPILEIIQANWAKQGKRPLSRSSFNKIHLMERVLMGPKDKPTALGKAFLGGLSEVSIFWTEEVPHPNGGEPVKVRFRARLDRLKPNSTIDLKTFSNWQGREFDKAMLREAAIRKYPVQAAHYDVAREQMRRLVDEGKIFAPADYPEDQIELLKKIAKVEKWLWCWVFYKSDGAPRAKGVVMDWRGKHATISSKAHAHRSDAILNFVQYASAFGLGHDQPMWTDLNTIWEPETEDWPLFADAGGE